MIERDFTVGDRVRRKVGKQNIGVVLRIIPAVERSTYAADRAPAKARVRFVDRTRIGGNGYHHSTIALKSLCHAENVMTHDVLMSERREPHPKDIHPGCDGEMEHVSGGFWDDIHWEIYVCKECHTPIAAVEGGPHWWNYVISDESRKRLGV